MIGSYTNEDRIPDDRATWRDDPGPPAHAEGFRQVTVDYGGVLERTSVQEAAWTRVVRWRFGWSV